MKYFADARTALRDEGVEYIFDNFDTYYSVLYYDESVDMDVLFKSYEDLHKGNECIITNL